MSLAFTPATTKEQQFLIASKILLWVIVDNGSMVQLFLLRFVILLG
jgi:hypothetical protein